MSDSGDSAVTFAIVGHNEAGTVQLPLRQALAAARPGDDVVFVDSASTDGSAQKAADLGVRIIRAPLGKGKAVAVALGECVTPWVCLLDADVIHSEANLAERLRAELQRDSSVGMVVGSFRDSSTREVLSNTWGIYDPLIDALFPTLVGVFGPRPLSGFRAVRVHLLEPFQALPPSFGLEAYINIRVGLSGARVRVVDLGGYSGRFLYKPLMGLEIGGAILDVAQDLGLIVGDDRRVLDEWMRRVVNLISHYQGEGSSADAFLERLARASKAEFPSHTCSTQGPVQVAGSSLLPN